MLKQTFGFDTMLVSEGLKANNSKGLNKLATSLASYSNESIKLRGKNKRFIQQIYI